MIFFTITLSILNAFLVMHFPLLNHSECNHSLHEDCNKLFWDFLLSFYKHVLLWGCGYCNLHPKKHLTRTAAYKHKMYMNGKVKSHFLVFKVSLLLSTFDRRSWPDFDKEMVSFLTKAVGWMYTAVYTLGLSFLQTCAPQCPLSSNTQLFSSLRVDPLVYQ